MVAHNAGFDISFIKENARQQGLEFNPTVLDTVSPGPFSFRTSTGLSWIR